MDRSIFESIKTDAAQLTEREYITVLILYALLAGNKATKDFSDAFLRHAALISQLHLSERLVKPAELDERATASLELFSDEATAILSSETWRDNMVALQCSCDVADLVDGRLLASCLKDKSIGRNETYQSLLQAMKSVGSGSIGNENAATNGTQGMFTKLNCIHRSMIMQGYWGKLTGRQRLLKKRLSRHQTLTPYYLSPMTCSTPIFHLSI